MISGTLKARKNLFWREMKIMLKFKTLKSRHNNNNNNNNNNNLHLYSADLYMNIFGCALQYCYIKFILRVTKA